MENKLEDKAEEKNKKSQYTFFDKIGTYLAGFVAGVFFCYPFVIPRHLEIKKLNDKQSIVNVYNSAIYATRTPGMIFIEIPNRAGYYLPLEYYMQEYVRSEANKKISGIEKVAEEQKSEIEKRIAEKREQIKKAAGWYK